MTLFGSNGWLASATIILYTFLKYAECTKKKGGLPQTDKWSKQLGGKRINWELKIILTCPLHGQYIKFLSVYFKDCNPNVDAKQYTSQDKLYIRTLNGQT